MATTLGKRRKKAAQPTAQDLVLALSKAVGIDLTESYSSDSFAQLWVDLYQSQDPDSYPAQGEYLYNLLTQLQGALVGQQETTAIVQSERRTKVWFQHDLQLHDLTDAQLVDELLVYPTVVTTVYDAECEDLSFLAIKVKDD